MLQIELTNISKRFVREWIIRDCSHTFQSGKSYAITGPNGSGKSSFAQILSGFSTPTSGKLSYRLNDSDLAVDDIFRYLSFSSPYMELIEEFTMKELLQFHFRLKPAMPDIDPTDLPELIQLPSALNKEIRHFSSGMKQRIKLGLAFYTESQLIILDEPTTNLDKSGKGWYLEQIQHLKKDKLVIVCSNQENEYAFCDEKLNVMNWK